MALRLAAGLNLLSKALAAVGAAINNGLLLEDNSSFILLEDSVSVLLLE